MSEEKKPQTSATGSGSGDPAATPVSREMESGRVVFDPRGEAVWEWRTGEGQFQRDASTSLVKKLEAHELSLEPTIVARKLHAEKPGNPAASCGGGGFDPYDNSTGRAGNGANARPSVAARQPPRPAVNAPRTEPGLLGKLKSLVAGRGSSGAR